jgi:predicted flap endonuclease-1-like 5' DNA nuclease
MNFADFLHEFFNPVSVALLIMLTVAFLIGLLLGWWIWGVKLMGLRSTLKSLRKEVEVLRKENTDYKERIALNEAEIKRSREEISSISNKNRQLEVEIGSLQNTINSLRADHKRAIGILTEDNVSLIAARNAMTRDLQLSHEHNADANTRINELQSALAATEKWGSEMEALKKAVHALEKDKTTLNKELNMAQEALIELQNSDMALRDQLEHWNTERTTTQTTVLAGSLSSNKEMDVWKAENEAIKEDVKIARNMIAKLQADEKELVQKIYDLEVAKNAQSNELGTNVELETLNRRINTLEKRNVELKEELKMSNSMIDRLQTDENELLQKLYALEATKSGLTETPNNASSDDNSEKDEQKLSEEDAAEQLRLSNETIEHLHLRIAELEEMLGMESSTKGFELDIENADYELKEIDQPVVKSGLVKDLDMDMPVVVEEAEIMELTEEQKKNLETALYESKEAVSNDLRGEDSPIHLATAPTPPSEKEVVKALLLEKGIIANTDESDDLELIVGIGPVIEKKLYELHISTFKQIAKLDEDTIAKVNAALEFFPGRIQRDKWVEQAAAFVAEREQGTVINEEKAKKIYDALTAGTYIFPKSKQDDLKLIIGIGAILEQKLHNIGIFNFDQLANLTPAKIAEIDDKLDFSGRIAREKWIEQAHAFVKAQKNGKIIDDALAKEIFEKLG